uniref:Uncharacterized protein n=1 Tax=Anser brachyrhynchus TaxID=132585 RepID=A0A8B9CB12_9AVES
MQYPTSQQPSIYNSEQSRDESIRLPHLISTLNVTCFSLKERLFLVRTLWLYLIIIKFFCFFFSLLVELANGLILVFFFTNSFLSVFPA